MQQCHHSYVGYSSFICQSFYSRSFTVVTLGAALTLCLLSTVQNSIAETAVDSAIVFTEKFKPYNITSSRSGLQVYRTISAAQLHICLMRRVYTSESRAL